MARSAPCGRAGSRAGIAGTHAGRQTGTSSESPLLGFQSLLPAFGWCCPGWEMVLRFLTEESPKYPLSSGTRQDVTIPYSNSFFNRLKGERAHCSPHSPRCARHGDVSLPMRQGYFKFVYLDDIRWFGCWHSTLAWQSSKYVHIYLYLAFFSGMFS